MNCGMGGKIFGKVLPVNLIRLAFRNIWRNKRRSALTISAMVVSSAMLLLAIGVSAGKMHDMLASATEQYCGHLVVSGVGYQADRSMYRHFAPEPALLERIEEHADIQGVSPRLQGCGLISFGQSSLPVEALGVDPVREKDVTTLQDSLTSGAGLGREDNGVLLGSGLAEKLGVRPGDELVFVAGASDGSIGNGLLVVKGIFFTGNERNDNELIMVKLQWLQDLFVLPGAVHTLAVKVRHPMQASVLATELRTALGNTFEVQDWSVFLPEIRDAIAISHVTNTVIMIIFYLATGLCVFNTFYMSVMERSYEFGLLMALGTRPRQIRMMVLLESFMMGGMSVLSGIALGFAINLYMKNVGIDLSGHISSITYAGGTILPRVHSEIDPGYQMMAATLLLLVCLAAGFLPANRAANMHPVQAMRGD